MKKNKGEVLRPFGLLRSLRDRADAPVTNPPHQRILNKSPLLARPGGFLENGNPLVAAHVKQRADDSQFSLDGLLAR